MQFNSDSAKIKYNSGMSKSDLEQGFEVAPSDSNLKGEVANKRLGLTNPWSPVCEPSDNTVEWSD